MSEVILVEDDDLEEGEIAEISEPELVNSPKHKHKKLPRRYTLNKNKDLKSNSKHKNYKIKLSDNCFQSHKKKHRSSCPRHTEEKQKSTSVSVNNKKSRNVNYFSYKGAFKNYTSPPRTVLNSEKKCPTNKKHPDSDDAYSKLLSDYKKTKERLKHIIETTTKRETKNFVSDKSVSNLESKIDPEQSECSILPLPSKSSVIPDVVTIEDSDDDDEEELRRIALATRSKKSVLNEKLSEASNDAIPDSSNCANKDSVNVHWTNCDNATFDNYEVVDMDLDPENIAENITNDFLFVIDKNPTASLEPSSHLVIEDSRSNSSLSKENKTTDNKMEHCFPSTPSESNDDFEEELLRAELIASMNSRKKSSVVSENERISPPIASDTGNNERNEKSAASHTVNATNFKSSDFSSKTHINNTKSFKLSTVKYSEPALPAVNVPNERLIIRLNNDSSSEESDSDVEKKPVKENVPISSIEALISNARHQSNIKSCDNSNRVSCLSKTQQEEYNSLKKILAEKDAFSAPIHPKVKVQNAAKPVNLNFLANKISTVKDNLKSQISLMDKEEKELLRKKQVYLASKLKVQLLIEQLHAAEIVRARHLEGWKKCTAKLDILKKSVAKRKVFINMLEKKFQSEQKSLNHNPV